MERPEPGTFIDNLPEVLYHDKNHGASSSDMKKILKTTPQHFKHFYDNPDFTPTSAMKSGTVMHCKVLRPEHFKDEVIVYPKLENKSKKQPLTMAEQKEAFEKKHKHMTCVTEQELETGLAMAKALENHQEAMRLLEDTIRERSLYAEALGAPLRARTDAYKENILIDLKSTRDASPRGFSNQIQQLQYHISFVHYAVCLEQCVPEIEDALQMEYYFVAVENEPPYAVATYKASPGMMEVAWDRWKFALNVFIECVESNFWPGYTPEDQSFEINLPAWAMPKDEEGEHE